MKTWYFAALFAAVVFLASSCKKDADDVTMNNGAIYGVVTDKSTGEPVQNAGVELLPRGLKTVTGTDGAFEFVGIAEGTYNLYVTKTGYADYKSNNLQVKASDKGNSVAVQLEKLPPALQVLDDNGVDISEIDFGASEGEVMRSFNIFNKSEANLEWEIIYQSDWIQSLNKQSATLKPGSTQVIVITINRDKLQEGRNSTVMHIISDNGSKQLTIKANGSVIVETLDPTGVTADMASLNGKLNRKPNSTILEYGFVYSTKPMPSVEDNERKLVVTGGANIGAFHVDATNLQNRTIYYYRAYVNTETDTYYGDIKSFTTLVGEYVILEESNLMVQSRDLGEADWSSANAMCKTSVVGGFSDWRLPTRAELMILYNNREHIGGFTTGYYWTSELYAHGDGYDYAYDFYYYVNFYSGDVGRLKKDCEKFCVRAVRTYKP
ncbi:MAG: carboxypeptidase regulatory-like domain-containing protein [Bacteroidaceae bacterium]|nr:carboxypeptidase regulatory-like domain-containing protein [Bacteroidaceae bacterium]